MPTSARELLVPFLHLWYGAAVGFEPKTSRSERGRSTNCSIKAVGDVGSVKVYSTKSKFDSVQSEISCETSLSVIDQIV